MTRLLAAVVGRRSPAPPADPRLVNFARGLAVGALIGAAIAGSSLWRYLRRTAD